MQTYTFMCLNKDGVAAAIDIVELKDGDYLGHANTLLGWHGSARAIEVWSETDLVNVVERSRLPPEGCAH
ncbi:hypothetical protein CFHF_20060 [Caulobacter flavus]|uniref:Uncharacterized protein n=1 Tax=Caulobacter flavus TaxID=1679497 RepID=A0A2N5CP58_9CAUL|nr:hypothetical protein [Caulobacter flavus]AYV48541.1 hypothetical protein C1707_21005 [Caulobacter flavus]PLR08743.1 hypothetical protein CFHF_20060 [Caulobacter flavus]